MEPAASSSWTTSSTCRSSRRSCRRWPPGSEEYALFYETKANLKREQVELLARAGVRWIQPGIESLDDNVLSLIAKGNSTLMNLQLLKWTREFGIDAAWNLLCGVPGESDGWYADMAAWLPAIFHLQPPTGVSRVRFDRFSPYHMRPQDFGLTLEPSRAYAYVYPLPRESLMRLAYSFEDSGHPRHVHRAMTDEPGQRRLQEVVREWNESWRTARPVLHVHDDGSRLHVRRLSSVRRTAKLDDRRTGGRCLPSLRLGTDSRLVDQSAGSQPWNRGRDSRCPACNRQPARCKGVAAVEGQATGAGRTGGFNSNTATAC